MPGSAAAFCIRILCKAADRKAKIYACFWGLVFLKSLCLKSPLFEGDEGTGNAATSISGGLGIGINIGVKDDRMVGDRMFSLG